MMMGRSALLGWMVIFCGVVFTSCNVDQKGRPTIDAGAEQTAIDPCRLVRELELQSIENFELGIGTLWWVSSDGTGEMSELPGREPAATEIEGGRCGISRYAMRLTAEGMAVYGGAFGINFYPEPLDVSKWDGITFWARSGPSEGRSLFVSVSEKHTDETNGAPLFDDNEPFCEELPDDPSRKCDRFGVGLGLESSWRLYVIYFDDMAQRGFGRPAPKMDLEALIGVSFAFETGAWDIWVDDVALFRTE